jgi:hypothetical protein
MNGLNLTTAKFITDLTVDSFEDARTNLKKLSRKSKSNRQHLEEILEGILAVRRAFFILADSRTLVDSELKEDGLNKLKAFQEKFNSHKLAGLLEELKPQKESPSIEFSAQAVSPLDFVRNAIDSVLGWKQQRTESAGQAV